MTLRHLNFATVDRLLIQGREYAFSEELCAEGAAPDSRRDLLFKDVRTGAHLTLGLQAFNQLYSAGQVRLLKPYEGKRDRPEEPVGGRESEVAQWRRRWCEAFDAAPSTRSDAALGAFIDRTAGSITTSRMPPSTGALRVWLRERGAPGDRRERFMAERGSDSSPLRIEPLAKRILHEKAEAFYDGLRVNPHAVYCATRASIAELNALRILAGLPLIRPPSESTVRRYLRRHMDYGRANRRYGYREGGRKFEPIRGAMEAKHILDKAIIDQTLIDCAVIDDEHMINVGRPWLAMMIDVRSRYPLGFCLSFEPPSAETALACVRHAVRPKTELAQAHPQVSGEWPAFGVPDTIVVDNAWENTGSSFRDACADANISITFGEVFDAICELGVAAEHPGMMRGSEVSRLLTEGRAGAFVAKGRRFRIRGCGRMAGQLRRLDREQLARA